MRIQFVSDLHLESRPEETFEIMIDPGLAPALALLGDIAPLNHPNLRPFLEWCSERWETIFYVPGKLELLGSSEGGDFRGVAAAVKNLEAICSTYQNIHVLYREAFYSDDGVLILGCPFWGCLATQPKAVRDLHREDLDWIKGMVREYGGAGRGPPFCILSHYGPVAWVQDERRLWTQADVPTIPEIELLLRKPIVAWIFGHHHGLVETHKLWNTPTGETREISLVCNGLGPELGYGISRRRAWAMSFRRDAVLAVNPGLYRETEI